MKFACLVREGVCEVVEGAWMCVVVDEVREVRVARVARVGAWREGTLPIVADVRLVLAECVSSCSKGQLIL